MRDTSWISCICSSAGMWWNTQVASAKSNCHSGYGSVLPLNNENSPNPSNSSFTKVKDLSDTSFPKRPVPGKYWAKKGILFPTPVPK